VAGIAVDEVVLGAVGFVSDDDDVVAVGEDGLTPGPSPGERRPRRGESFVTIRT
jgi:predicted secreted protein